MDIMDNTSSASLAEHQILFLSPDPPWNNSNVSLEIGNGYNITTAAEDSSHFPQYMSLLMSLVCGFILTVGLIGNCLVPVVIWNNRDLRNSTNLFLLNLSIADILVLCVSMPTVLVEIHTRPEVWILGELMCKVVPFVELTVAHASVLTILAISFERYYVITRPLRAGYTCTRMRALFVILIIWILGCISTSPMLFIAHYQDGDNELGDDTSNAVCLTQAHTFWSSFYFISAICIFFFLPLIILIVVYTVIARHLVADPCTAANHRMQVTSANTNDNPNLRARRQVVAMLGTVVMFFFICLLPFRIFTLWIIVVPEEDIHEMSLETYYNALNFCRVMLYINSAINPILYNVMSSKFRSAFLKALGLNWRRKRLLRHLSRQSTFNTTTSGTTTTTSTAASGKSRYSENNMGAGELVKNMAAAKEFIFTQNAHHNIGGSKPLLHKYGRQGSCNSSSATPMQRQVSRVNGLAIQNDGSSKPLITITKQITTCHGDSAV